MTEDGQTAREMKEGLTLTRWTRLATGLWWRRSWWPAPCKVHGPVIKPLAARAVLRGGFGYLKAKAGQGTGALEGDCRTLLGGFLCASATCSCGRELVGTNQVGATYKDGLKQSCEEPQWRAYGCLVAVATAAVNGWYLER